MTRLVLPALLCVLWAFPRHAGSQELEDSATIAAAADSIAAELLEGPPRVAGVAIAVQRRGERIFEGAYGFADVVGQEPLSPSDPLQIGSITKQFTAAAILQLVEEGKVGLEDSVQAYLPDFDTQGHTVTLRHLLNHTSGIRSYTAIFGTNPVPRETLLDSIQSHAYDFEPGEAYRYNNSGYYLLGVILEAATGERYGDYMAGRFFRRLGLEATTLCGHRAAVVPSGYEPTSSGLEPAVLSDMEYPGAAGGLCSTVDDLLDWQEALVAGDVVSPEAYGAMTTPTVLSAGRATAYGYGLQLARLGDYPRVWHGGGTVGFNAFLSYYPEQELGIAILANTSTGRLPAFEEVLARAALGLERFVKRDLPLDAEQRAAYVGTYDLGSRLFRVFDQDGSLIAEPTGQRPVRLMYQGDDAFRPDLPADILIEFHVENSRAGSLTLHQGGQAVEAPRLAVDDRP